MPWSATNHTFVFLAEYIGCLFFTFCASLDNTPWTNGCMLALYVYLASHISSGNLNPAVSLAFVLLGHTHLYELPLYVAAQVLGCLTGATFAKYLVPWATKRELGCFTPAPELNEWQICGVEFLLTMSFIISIFVVVFYNKEKLGFGNMGPFLIGLALSANAFAGAGLTGSALNPARVIASPIVIGCSSSIHLHSYILGQFGGAIAASMVIAMFFGINAEAWYLKWFSTARVDKVPGFVYERAHGEHAPTTIHDAKAHEAQFRQSQFPGRAGRHSRTVTPINHEVMIPLAVRTQEGGH
jgi:glycerol uptake facilitator-like aquaporin